MGWYHVAHYGKGIFLGESREIKYDVDFLAKYEPSKEEAIAFGKNEYGEDMFADYDSWPVLKKLAVVPKNLWALRGDYYGEFDYEEHAYLLCLCSRNAMAIHTTPFLAPATTTLTL